MPVCPDCGSQQPGGANFCDECGAKLGEEAGAASDLAPSPPSPQAASPAPITILICSKCYAQLDRASRFCHMCGTPVRTTAAPSTSRPALPAQPATAPAPSPDRLPEIVIEGHLVVQDTQATLSFQPGKTEVVIGREDPIAGVFPDIDLTDHGGDEEGVSRRHARIFVRGTEFFIEDLNSTNYTYVNQQKVTPGQPHPLNIGDEIQLGRLKLNFDGPASTSPPDRTAPGDA